MATPPAQHGAPTDIAEERILQRYWQDWTIPAEPPTSPDAFFPFLRMMFLKQPKGSALKEAVLTLAYANYRARLLLPEVANEALRDDVKNKSLRHYVKVVELLQEFIKAPHEPLTNEIMLSVTLLAMYEVSAAILICRILTDGWRPWSLRISNRMATGLFMQWVVPRC
jgi:hypothetical protein